MKHFIRGLRAGIPIGLGYLSVSFSFGIIAVAYGLTWWQATLISMANLTSAGQFAGIGIMLTPGQYAEMLISQLTINVRYSFMSISLSQKLHPKFKGIFRWLLAFAMTDEIFAVATTEEEVTKEFFTGLATIPYFGWALGTLLGALLGGVLPASVMSALGLALYGMFVAIVAPTVREGRAFIFIIALSAALSCAFTYIPCLKEISSGLSISICAVVAAALGALIFPVNTEKDSYAANEPGSGENRRAVKGEVQ